MILEGFITEMDQLAELCLLVGHLSLVIDALFLYVLLHDGLSGFCRCLPALPGEFSFKLWRMVSSIDIHSDSGVFIVDAQWVGSPRGVTERVMYRAVGLQRGSQRRSQRGLGRLRALIP